MRRKVGNFETCLVGDVQGTLKARRGGAVECLTGKDGIFPRA